MQNLVFFTQNPGKLAEAQQALSPLGITVVPRPYSFLELQTDDQLAIIRHKFDQVRTLESLPFLVDDAAIYFSAYRQFPGVMTRHIFDMLGYEGLLRLLPPGVDRRAYYRGLLGYARGGVLTVFEGTCEGEILPAPSQTPDGLKGFPYDRIFCPAGETRAMADLTPETRLTYSYRGQALARLVVHLQQEGNLP